MSEPKIYDDLPKHISKAVLPFVEKHLSLLPTWCHSLSLQMTGEDVRASCDSAPEYRAATVLIGAHYMNDSDEQRENTIVHEFLHVTLSPLDQMAYTLAPKAEDNPEAAELAHEAIRRALEGCVCDFMRYMGRHVRGPMDAVEGVPPPEPPKRR